MMPEEKTDDGPSRDDFLGMMVELSIFMQSLQDDVSVNLIQDSKIKAKTEELIQRHDHEIVEILDNVVSRFVMLMPLANLYGVNLTMSMVAKLATIAGDKEMIEAFYQIWKTSNEYNN